MLTWFDYICHWTGFWCKMRIYRKGEEVLVEIGCRVCAKRAVTPEAWERVCKRKP
jgi:hypothetical protein